MTTSRNNSHLSKSEIIDWTLDQLYFSGLFDRNRLDIWRVFPLSKKAMLVSGAFNAMPPTEKAEIAMRFYALGANRESA
jgi:hypothetical protein